MVVPETDTAILSAHVHPAFPGEISVFTDKVLAGIAVTFQEIPVSSGCYMRTGFYILFILALAPGEYTFARDVDSEFAAFGIGGKTCQDYLAARRKTIADQLPYSDWLEGYLSAFNLIVDNTYDIMGGRKLNKALDWLDKYCQKYQSHIFANAVAALTVKLYPTRQNLSPNRNIKQEWAESEPLAETEESE